MSWREPICYLAICSKRSNSSDNSERELDIINRSAHTRQAYLDLGPLFFGSQKHSRWDLFQWWLAGFVSFSCSFIASHIHSFVSFSRQSHSSSEWYRPHTTACRMRHEVTCSEAGCLDERYQAENSKLLEPTKPLCTRKKNWLKFQQQLEGKRRSAKEKNRRCG